MGLKSAHVVFQTRVNLRQCYKMMNWTETWYGTHELNYVLRL